jgi:hypothetical protein
VPRYTGKVYTVLRVINPYYFPVLALILDLVVCGSAADLLSTGGGPVVFGAVRVTGIFSAGVGN